MAFDASDEKKLGRIAADLLGWYDANARDLPWRVGPDAIERGERPDPYRVWLSEIMLQQTTVATVTPRFREFLKRWPRIDNLAAAPLDDVLGAWAGLGYYARARNLHRCAVEVAQRGGFPDTEEGLKTLPGIGDYTAAAIAAIAFGRRAVVVDGNIERVVARLFMIAEPLPAAKKAMRNSAERIWPDARSGDFAQGLMDLGATICRPKKPACLVCPIADHCQANGERRAEEFPVRPAKKTKPSRKGSVFALTNAKGEVLFERRPEKGMLGGMLGLPGTNWSNKNAAAGERLPLSFAPVKASWTHAGDASHSFTHFDLDLEVFVARAPKGFRRGKGQQWIAPEKASLPTVMRKAIDVLARERPH